MHWIVEHMLFEGDRRGHMSAGVRVSCDNGRSWVVAGHVAIARYDSVSVRTRSVKLSEYVHRCNDAHRVLLIDYPMNGDIMWYR